MHKIIHIIIHGNCCIEYPSIQASHCTFTLHVMNGNSLNLQRITKKLGYTNKIFIYTLSNSSRHKIYVDNFIINNEDLTEENFIIVTLEDAVSRNTCTTCHDHDL